MEKVPKKPNRGAKLMKNFINKVKAGKFTSTSIITNRTVNILKDIIKESDWKNAQRLLVMIKTHGKNLEEALPVHASVGNMVRRVLKIIREEYTAARKNKQDELDPQDSLHKIVTSEGEIDDYSIVVPELKDAILDHISEFQTELETSSENIRNQAKEHIHSNEIILTLGRSKIVEQFLKKAAEDRKFEVIVVECAPFNNGSDMAASLSESNIETTLIPDSAVFAIMSRVNKVIIGTQTVMANGGLRAICGSHTAALAANHCSVPVIVLAPLYKFSPQFLCAYAHNTFNTFVSPEGVLDYKDGDLLSQVHVYNPVYDYVPPELVTLFISNTGGHAPSYVYRLLSELYHPDDYSL
ncbi:hypothetical protein LSTR_LSTR001978 [Laodelphax striatellus]|uniref:Translation initiation factor eIF2B subunit beta n=1 Tax=Laodelphax striatellus TaxID=195883 RepID=A0A482XH40_LAOST|nr:hypothetical protein LSTR_LSTR001978 [Laodelphax striatellus]